jgi:soluble lytic murein transglycosylase-like protein
MKKPYRSQILKAAEFHNVDPDLIEAIVWQESSGYPSAYRYEPAYWERYCKNDPRFAHEEPRRIAASYGLMQLMYPTALSLGYTGTPEGLFEIEVNLDLGTKLVAQLLQRYHGQRLLALAAYNGGPGGTTRPGPLSYAASVNARYERMKA